ncbi:hypothetical protein RU01_07710 [Rhodococcus sp. MEB064]|nr:hypothetical protein RU01_07710 [Rhodococcus sp. MEB064]
MLTEAGAELSPVMDSLARWSTQWMTHVDASEQLSVSDLIEQVSTAVDRTLVPDGRVRIAFVSGNAGREEGWVDVGDFGSHAGLGSTAAEADLTVKASLRVLNDLWSRRRSCDDTVLRRDIAFDGPISYARAFTTWFPRRPGDASSSTPS